MRWSESGVTAGSIAVVFTLAGRYTRERSKNLVNRCLGIGD
jgi:hypothetical protein